MNTLTVYSPTHETLFKEWFEPTFKATNGNSKLTAVAVPQLCSGAYRKDTWRKQVALKTDIIAEFLASNINEDLVCYSDCDIQFFGDIDAAIEEYDTSLVDIAAQEDDGMQMCSGFMIMHPSVKLASWFKSISTDLRAGRFAGDQAGVNSRFKFDGIKVMLLGPEFFSVWRVRVKAAAWPDKIVMHHANYVVGVPGKIKTLKDVRARFKPVAL